MHTNISFLLVIHSSPGFFMKYDKHFQDLLKGMKYLSSIIIIKTTGFIVLLIIIIINFIHLFFHSNFHSYLFFSMTSFEVFLRFSNAFKRNEIETPSSPTGEWCDGSGHL